MSYWLSTPAETLLASGVENDNDQPQRLMVETLIIGSGYGAAMAALVLGMKRKGTESIWVFERGQEYLPGDFPKAMGDTPGYLPAHRNGGRAVNADALWDVRMGDGVSVVVGSGLGGTSLVNASVALRPDAKVFEQWPAPPGDALSWQEQLKPSFEFVEQLLGVNAHPDYETFPKYRALKKLAKSLDQECNPAPIAVNFNAGENIVGVQQPACTDCGNCVTGCNIGAKNHLGLNVWPLARDLDVKIYTGATVHSLFKDEDGWIVRTHLTTQDDKSFEVRARRVVLAAGTIGSTEILQRSKKELSLSAKLGERFSINGDALVFGYGQRERVQAVATTPSTSDAINPLAAKVGPTIVGCVRLPAGALRTLEEGAIPYPLARLWGELITTQALPRRWTERKPSAWHIDHPATDPITVSDDLLDHGQTLLCMGMDEGDGTLDLNNGRLVPKWKKRDKDHRLSQPKDEDFYQRLHRELKGVEKRGGFDGGYYLPGPQWKFFPDDMDGIAEGVDKAGGHAITVHPLGGCAMGNDAGSGVVNHRGQVFSSREGTDVYADLYVLDGAIIPGALGVNPLLTIAALAHSLTELMEPTARIQSIPKIRDSRWKTAPRMLGYPMQNPADRLVALRFRERPFGQLEGAGAAGVAAAIEKHLPPEIKKKIDVSTLLQQKGLVVGADIDIPDAFAWLADPAQSLTAKYSVYANLNYESTLDTIPPYHPLTELFTTTGTVRLLALDRPRSRWQRWTRAVSALRRFFHYRGDEPVAEVKDRIASLVRCKPVDPNAKGLFKTLLEYWRVAKTFADWRTLDYQFEHELAPGVVLRFNGSKRLAYSKESANVWDALTNLPFEMSVASSDSDHVASGHLRVDLINMMRDLTAYQVMKSPDMPTSLMAMGGLGTLFVRSVLQTHFWSFGAPGYKHFSTKRQVNKVRMEDPPATMLYQSADGPRSAMRTMSTDHLPPDENVLRRLTRYLPQDREAVASLLLIHGGAHGSRVFWTETIQTNLVQHLLAEGYDVWLLDHRYSSGLKGAKQHADLDQVSCLDIPWAVKSVYEATAKPVHIFGHCVGGGAVAMSILKGRLYSSDGQPMVASTALHAVTPWLVTAEINRLRAYLLSMFRDRLPVALFDPIPHQDFSLWDNVFDRLGSSIPWSDNDWQAHRQGNDDAFSRTVCNRMTLFYGQQWNHGNLAPTTHKNLAALVGPGAVELFKHVYYCTVRGHLTNKQGGEVYLTKNNLSSHWNFPTLFLHGKDNLEFSPESSRLSAYMLAYSRVPEEERAAWVENPNYPAHKVWLSQVEDMGHLDMLFGDNACENGKGFQAISNFFNIQNGQEPLLPNDDSPRRHVSAWHTPQMGPIVSRPRRIKGKYLVRVWMKTGQVPPRETLGIDFIEGTKLPLNKVNWIRQPNISGGRERDGQREFWLGDIVLPDDPESVAENICYSINSSFDEQYKNSGDDTFINELKWCDKAWFRRLVQGKRETNDGALSFLAGSCLYPGSPFEQEMSDDIFKAMLPHTCDTSERSGVDHLMLMGDQIYSDASADILDSHDMEARYRERYRRAFGSAYSDKGKNARAILSTLPSYFVLDDHEIKENWDGGLRQREELDAFIIARREAWNYQMHHDGLASPRCKCFWYHFESAGFPFFVFDTRTERCNKNRAHVGTLMKPEQLDGFSDWLKLSAEHIKAGKPIFISSGSPLGPIPNDLARFPSLANNHDNLLGYPGFLQALHGLLVTHHVDNVIWLSGDPHFSCVADIVLEGCVNGVTKTVEISHIVASGLYSPLPFANERPDHYEWQRPTTLTYSNVGLTVKSTPRLLTANSRHFVRVDVGRDTTQWPIAVEAIDASGVLLQRVTL